jgi:hypothetical protein
LLDSAAVKLLGRRFLSSGLLALLLVALAGVHIHAVTAKLQDGVCLACVLSSTHEGVDGPAIVPAPESAHHVSPSAEVPAARPSLPDLTGRSPPTLPAA